MSESGQDRLLAYVSPTTGEHDEEWVWLWCPGCDAPHSVVIAPSGWTWNGDVSSPSITPSIKVEQVLDGNGEVYSPACHSFVTDGQWHFLDDTGHEFSGGTIPCLSIDRWGFQP